MGGQDRLKIPWNKRNPAHLIELNRELGQRYPDLCLCVAEDSVFLKGGFPVVHDGVELDRFQITVRIPSDFPESIPLVREMAGRVPHTADWHTYEKGLLCIIVPEEWLINPAASSVVAFLDGPVRNFFIGHALAEAGIKRPMGERSHCSPGLLEAYGEMVGSKEPAVTRKYLEYLAKDRVKGHWDCPCGSLKRLRHCHMSDMLALQNKFPSRFAKMALKRLQGQEERETRGREK